MRSLAVLLILLSTAAWSQDMPKPGQVYQERRCELRGKPAKLGLAAYRIIKEADSYWGQLKVWDGQGKLIWQAPQAKMPGDPFAFGMWPFGSSGLEWISGDLLLSPHPQSDVRPATYHRYRWTGAKFQALPSKMLLEVPLNSGNFAWSTPIQWDGVTPKAWVMEISGSPSAPVAKIYVAKSGTQVLVGEAKVLATSDGFRVASWIKKPAAE